jgi:ligand-binding SRPBCC domain-containing protein
VQTLDHDQLSVHIDAPPEVVYALIADVTRTPEFSPEIVSCTWLGGATGPAAGARFEAVNKVTRGPTWKNRPVVITAESGREFAFSRTEKLSGTLVWRYQFQPDGGGTRLTESYEVTRPISRLGWFIIDRLFGCHDRRAELRAGMGQTLQRIRETAERGLTSGHTPPRQRHDPS